MLGDQSQDSKDAQGDPESGELLRSQFCSITTVSLSKTPIQDVPAVSLLFFLFAKHKW